MIKVCIYCKEEKEEILFKKDYKKRDPPSIKYTNQCLECDSKIFKEWRKKNKETYNQRCKERRWERKERAIKYKGGICEHCKQIFPACAFDFHHLDQNEKDKDPGLMMSTSDETLFKELDKCILLCANCHRMEHFTHGY